MKELKFKIFDKLTKEMYGPGGLELSIKDGKLQRYWYETSSPGSAIRSMVASAGLFLDLNRYVLIEYIGLKDANGKEIYGGDIVRITDHKFSSRPSPFTKVVEWNNDYGYCIGGGLVEKIEILGNIYQNPELKQY